VLEEMLQEAHGGEVQAAGSEQQALRVAK